MRIHSLLAVPFLTAALLSLSSGHTALANASKKAPASALASPKARIIHLSTQKLPFKSRGAQKVTHVYTGSAGNKVRLIQVADAVPEPRVLTEEDNGGALTLQPGDTLVVRLRDAGSTGYLWSLIDIPGMPVRLESQQRTRGNAAPGVVGAPGIHEWRFVATAGTFGRTSYLKLLQLRPFAPGVKDATIWEVKVSVPASK